MIDASRVAAVLVTRGDVDLEHVLWSLPSFAQVVVWNNSADSPETDLAVYGRYAGIERTRAPVIYVQDDDCLLAPRAFDELLAAYVPGRLVANMPERFRTHYPDSCLVGFGALFDRDLPAIAFGRFAQAYGVDDVFAALEQDPGFFHRECDAIVATLTPRVLVDVPYHDREFASDASRMWKQAGHYGDRQRMLELARKAL